MPSGTFGLDSVLANKRFVLDAWVVGNRLRHDRTADHSGTQDTTTVVLSSAIGQYPAGTTVQAVLESMVNRILSLESANHAFGFFTFDAFVQPRFTLNAVIVEEGTASFTLDAVLNLAGPGSFTLNAVIFVSSGGGGGGGTRSFTLAAFIV